MSEAAFASLSIRATIREKRTRVSVKPGSAPTIGAVAKLPTSGFIAIER
jgi:hypothetical protein